MTLSRPGRSCPLFLPPNELAALTRPDAVLAISLVHRPSHAAHPGFCGLLSTAHRFGYRVLVPGWGANSACSSQRAFAGTDSFANKTWARLQTLADLLGQLPATLTAVVLDGFDAVFANDARHLHESFARWRQQTGRAVAYQAECNSWPRCYDAWYERAGVRCPAGLQTCYMNAGVVVGLAAPLAAWLRAALAIRARRDAREAAWLPRGAKYIDDQDLLNGAFASGVAERHGVGLDHHSALSLSTMQCTGGRSPSERCRRASPRTHAPLAGATVRTSITTLASGTTSNGTVMLAGGNAPSIVHCNGNAGKRLSLRLCERLALAHPSPPSDAPVLLLPGYDQPSRSFHDVCSGVRVPGRLRGRGATTLVREWESVGA